MKKVVILVDCGIPYISVCPKDIDIQIVDFDNLKSKGYSVKKRNNILGKAIEEAETHNKTVESIESK